MQQEAVLGRGPGKGSAACAPVVPAVPVDALLMGLQCAGKRALCVQMDGSGTVSAGRKYQGHEELERLGHEVSYQGHKVSGASIRCMKYHTRGMKYHEVSYQGHEVSGASIRGMKNWNVWVIILQT